MIESFQGRIPQTPRLSFNADEVSDADVPAFLRRAKERHKTIERTYDHSNVIDIRSQMPSTPVAEPADEDIRAVTYEIDRVDVINIVEDVTMENIEVEVATTAPTVDLEGPSIDELEKQKEAIQRAIEERRRAEKEAVIEQIKKVMTDFNIPLEDVVEAMGGLKIKRKGVPAQVKYRDPETGTEWSGRGKEPSWLKGRNKEDFLIR